MTQAQETQPSHVDNPLDHVEDVLTAHNWVFDRMNDEELIVDVIGRNCNYRVLFVWQDDMNALQFCVQYDLKIPHHRMNATANALMDINQSTWMGHFEISSETGKPAFRQTCLFRGIGGGSQAQNIEDLVDISLAQCERYYATFYVLANDNQNDLSNKAELDLAMMDIAGES